MKILNLFKNNKAPVVSPLTRTEALACIPVKTAGTDWKVIEDGHTLIEYPLPLKPFFLGLAERFGLGETRKLTKKLQLDGTGTRVWNLLDGKNDVKTIITEVAGETGLTLQEAELSVTTFLRELGRRGLIVLK